MTVVAAPPLCDLPQANCRCALELGHDGPHACECGGSWHVGADGEVEVVRLPPAAAWLFPELVGFEEGE